jgi:hypothetical protein
MWRITDFPRISNSPHTAWVQARNPSSDFGTSPQMQPSRVRPEGSAGARSVRSIRLHLRFLVVKRPRSPVGGHDLTLSSVVSYASEVQREPKKEISNSSQRNLNALRPRPHFLRRRQSPHGAERMAPEVRRPRRSRADSTALPGWSGSQSRRAHRAGQGACRRPARDGQTRSECDDGQGMARAGRV